jgi:general secretion pathway protein G
VQTLNKRLAAMRNDDGGFTLIELLVVIVIIGILSGIVLFGVGSLRDEGEKSACAAAEDTIRVAEEAYFTLEGEYADESVLYSDAVGLLDSDSEHYDVEASADGSSYSWSVPTGSSCTAPTT